MIRLPPWVRRADPDRIPSLVGGLGSRPVVVSDATIRRLPEVERLVSEFACEVLEVPATEPSVSSVQTLAGRIADAGAEVVVAVGGGSVLDSAKLGGRLRDSPEALVTVLRSAAPVPVGASVVAIPTTSGSGAEVTRTAIVSHEGRKTWAWDDRLRPDLAVLSPALLGSTPGPVVLAAGLDAFSHAVEAGTGRRRTGDVSALAFAAASAIHRQLSDSLQGEMAARAAMMEAATAAGLAIDSCGTGIGHAVGHALGSILTIPHGLAVMAGLRAGLAWTVEGAPEAFGGLATALGVRIDQVDRAVEAFCATVGLDEALRRWPAPSAEALASEMGHPDHLPMRQNNARPIGNDDLETVARLVTQRWPA